MAFGQHLASLPLGAASDGELTPQPARVARHRVRVLRKRRLVDDATLTKSAG